jgi:hypothetical protein
MFRRCNRRKKDGKTHDYWSVVESRRCGDGRVVQRQVLYLGEINASQREAWRKTIEVQDAGTRRQVALFPAGSMPVDDVDAIGVRLSELSLRRARQWGACWLALQLWQQLELDSFWRPKFARAQGSTPARSGDCTASGSTPARWEICWSRTSAWPRRIRCTAAWTGLSNTKTSCSSSCCAAGANSSAPGSTCCCTT